MGRDFIHFILYTLYWLHSSLESAGGCGGVRKARDRILQKKFLDRTENRNRTGPVRTGQEDEMDGIVIAHVNAARKGGDRRV